MKKLFTSLALLCLAVTGWSQNPKFEDGTLTITYEDGMDFNNLLEDSWKGNVDTLVLKGAFTNAWFTTGGPAENFIGQCTNSTLYLDLEECTGIASLVVPADGSESIDWEKNTNGTFDGYKYTTPNIVKAEEKTDWYTDAEFTTPVYYGYDRIYEENGNYYWTGYDGDTPKQVWPKTTLGYYNNGNFTEVSSDDVDENGMITLEGEGTKFEVTKFASKLNGITFPKDNENFNAIPVELIPNQTNLQTIVISDGIVSVASGAFQGNKNLTSVTFGSTLENIDYKAFEATGITGTLNLPASLVTIKGDAFKECTSVSDIIIPEGSALEHIYKGAFLMDSENKLKNVYVNCNKIIQCDEEAFGMNNTDGQTVAGSVTTRLYYPPQYYEHYVGSYKTNILGGSFDSHEAKLDNRTYAQGHGGTVTGTDGNQYTNTDYPNGNGWWEFLSTGIPTPADDWVVDNEDYWRTYSESIPLIVPEGFDEGEAFSSDAEKAKAGKGINVYLVDGFEGNVARLVRMKVGDVIPANTGVILHWRAEISDPSGAFFFLPPALENMEGYGNQPYDNELDDENLYKGYRNYLKPLNTRGQEVTIKNVEKKKGKAQYRNFFWGNKIEYANADPKYKGNEFDQADANVELWGFYRAVTGTYKINNKAYLHLPAGLYSDPEGAGLGENHDTDTNSSANAFGFVIVGSDMTGISNVNVAEKTDNSYYTLQGVKLNQPTERGIYIHNGKKIILK